MYMHYSPSSLDLRPHSKAKSERPFGARPGGRGFIEAVSRWCAVKMAAEKATSRRSSPSSTVRENPALQRRPRHEERVKRGLAGLPEPGVQKVPDAVPQEVESEDQQEDGDRGQRRNPPLVHE